MLWHAVGVGDRPSGADIDAKWDRRLGDGVGVRWMRDRGRGGMRGKGGVLGELDGGVYGWSVLGW